ncbi:MAG: DUF1549 domain-containing protein, partial [Myxococcaceae bacterium]
MNFAVQLFRAAVLVASVAVLLAAAPASAEPPVPEKVTFNRDVRPILSDNCFACHGFDAHERKAERRLDTREGALAENEGVKAIVPGNPGESETWLRIISDDKDELMPPPKSGKRLSNRDREILRRWIEQGAEYQDHWAYVKPVKAAIPAGAHPVDLLVAQQLETQGLQLSPEADRRTLIRRLSFDLIGLPPKPEEVEAFVKDQSPDAYSRLVERLLASPHYGERMAIPWLDVVRYADTTGWQQAQTHAVPAPGALTPLTRRERPAVLPLSFAQQRLWFIHQLGVADAAYHVPLALKLEGTVDLAALQRSFDELMRRHEALRTTFRAHEGDPEQVIHPVLPLPVRQVDLTGITDPEQRHAEAAKLAREETRSPFDLEQGPLIRALLLKLSPTEHVLVLNQHHIISDGWSTGVLVREMGTLYATLSRGLASPLPELPVQYADHALWQRDWLRGEVLEHQLGYWRQQLEGAPSHLELPTDHPRPARQSFQGALLPLTLPRTSSEALEALARREGVTPFMVLLAAFQVLLGRYAGQDDVLVGSPIAGRRHAEAEALIGYFANTVVLRTRLRPQDTFRALLTQVRDTTLGAYEHQDLPFEKLVEALHPTRDPARTPFFQVTFTLQNAPLPKLELPGLSLQPMNADPG